MNINFKKVKLGEVCIIESGGTPSSKVSEYWSNGNILWATLPDLKKKYIYDTIRKITKKGLNKSSAKLLPKNTVIFSSRATIGEVAIAKYEVSTNQGSKNFICDPQKIHYEFLYYLLKAKKSSIENIASGATYREINKTVLSNYEVDIPLILYQKKIASILSAYDKLIENNTKRIEILEEIAQRIYKEWFVDFKYPGHENGELIDSELGMIPQDWQILEYDSITNIISRGPSIKYVNEDSGIPVLNQKCVRNGEIELDAIKYGSPLNTNKEHCYLQLNDILINSMGVGTLGRISRNLSIKSKMIIHNCITFVRADESKVKQSFLYYSLKRNQIYFEQLGIGATGQTSLKIDIIKGKEVIVPKQNLLIEFDKLVNPFWKEIGFLKNKNHNLQQTRDHLLPKLISGKVDVSDLDIDTSILDD